jgi:hypothetical protein
MMVVNECEGFEPDFIEKISGKHWRIMIEGLFPFYKKK